MFSCKVQREYVHKSHDISHFSPRILDCDSQVACSCRLRSLNEGNMCMDRDYTLSFRYRYILSLVWINYTSHLQPCFHTLVPPVGSIHNFALLRQQIRA